MRNEKMIFSLSFLSNFATFKKLAMYFIGKNVHFVENLKNT